MTKLFLIFGLLAISIQAAETPNLPGDRAIRAYMSAQAAALEKEFLPDVKTAEDFEKIRPGLRQTYFEMLGLWPLPEKKPLNAKVTGRLELQGFTVEKLHFQSRPGLYVTANLYLPSPLPKEKIPAILYQCGHSYMQRDGNKSAYQDHGIWFSTHGYACLITDSLQLGEIGAIHHGTYREGRWWWHSAGYTSAGVECWNGIRAIDYLQSRPEIDPEKIGATGISGGGAATFWVSAADERIKCTAPTSGMSDLQYYVGEDGVNGHCDCMFLYNRARWNWTTIAALVCPRPLLFVNSDADLIFPMSGNERVINRLKRLYSHFGVSDHVNAVVSDGGHAYRSDLRRQVYEFFNRQFRYDAHPVTDPDAGLAPPAPGLDEKKRKRIPFSDLRVFPEDKDIPADQINTKIDQLFVPLAKNELPTRENFESWRKGLLERLRVMTFNAWPAEACAPNAQPDAPNQGREMTENGVEVAWRLFPGKNAGNSWLIILNEGDTTGELPEWAKPIVGDNSALILNPRGTGALAWTRKNPPNTVERSMALLGATVDGGRVWDALTVVRRRLGNDAHWNIAGSGNAGILAAYAALYEPAIESVVAVNPPPSHRPLSEGAAYGPALLNVLRVLDIPEAFGCLAPRKVTLIGAKDAAFDRTAQIFKIVGAEDKFERK